MGRPKANRTLIAERALKDAIESECATLQAQLDAAHGMIDQLNAALRALAGQALAACTEAPQGGEGKTGTIMGAPTFPRKNPAILPDNDTQVLSTGPSVELAEDDDLGDGRWV